MGNIGVMKKFHVVLMFLACVFCIFGCQKLPNVEEENFYDTDVEEWLITVLEEKYPENAFTVTGEEGIYYILEDQEGISFFVEILEDSEKQFWCKDNYIESYYAAKGVLEQCNSLMQEYGVNDGVETGDSVTLNLGILDDSANYEKMCDCLYELGMLLQLPFEISYYDKGTPQSGEEYQGSTTTGTFSHLGFEMEFNEPYIMQNQIENAILLKVLQGNSDREDYAAIIDNLIQVVMEYNAIGKALDENYYHTVQECIANGGSPSDDLGEDYDYYSFSIHFLQEKMMSISGKALEEVTNDGMDEEGNLMISITDEEGDSYRLHLGKNDDNDYSFKLEYYE